MKLIVCIFLVLSCAKTLKKHEQNKHPETPGQYICDLCGKAWNSVAYLRTHRNKTHRVKADGTPYPPRPLKQYKPKNVGRERPERYGRREGYGRLLPDGKTMIGTKYVSIDNKLKCRDCDKCESNY